MSSYELTEAIIFLMGAFFLIAGLVNLRKRTLLIKNGIRAEGVIFRIEKEYRPGNTVSSLYYPVVRYITVEKEWVTKKSDTQIFPGLYKEGDKIEVVYDSVNKSKFLIDNWASRWVPLLFMLVGIVLIVIGVLSLLRTNSISI